MVMTRRHRGPYAALAAALSVALSAGAVAGCAGTSPVGAGSSASAPSGATSGEPSGVPESGGVSPEPSVSYGGGARPPVVPPVKPRPGGGGVKLVTGTVSAGVEPGCLLLDTGAERWVLLTTDARQRSAARPGTRVTVTGTARPDLVTTCQQGTPLQVTAIRAG